jgi:FAD/FMN-containing dehydrogenase
MNRIRSLDRIAMTVEADAGCIVRAVKDAATAAGRMLPIGFGAEGSATVGGMVSTNAGGVNALRYGTARQLVLGLEAVLADGTMLRGLRGLRKDNAGYDWKQLLIGSEGTLGIVTGVLLRLVPLPADRAAAWLTVDSPGQALRLLEMILDHLGESLMAFELMSAATLAKGEEHLGGAPPLSGSPWHVLVEVADSAGDTAIRLEAALLAAAEAELLVEAVPAPSETRREHFWRLRERLGEAELMAGPSAKHDVSVAVSDVPSFLEAATEAVHTLDPGLSVNAYGHMADGNIHYNVMLEGRTVPVDLINVTVHDVVADFDGSIAAEHGIGQSRVAELERLKDPGELRLLRTLKRTLDPDGLLNPGKVLPVEGPG